MLSTVVNGRVESVRGDPDHPFTRGALCPKVRDYQERVYHPDRVLYPLRRVGPKGEGRFERVSWSAALDEIHQRFSGIIGRHGPQAILPCSYLGQQGLLNGLHCGDAFFNRLGASVAERTFCNAGATLAYNMTLGNTPGLDPESFVHAKLIVVWACNIIGSMPHHWPFIREAQRRGTKLVVVDPLRSRTAAHADRHVRPRPGTDAALALGLMNVLFEEDLIDADYANANVLGLEALRERAGAFPVDRAASITGLEGEEIRSLAREYGSTRASAIRVGVAIERHANGPNAMRAISLLPALTGAWREVGGGIFQNAGRAFPMQRAALGRPDFIPEGTRVVNVLSLGAALTGQLGLDPPVEALFVYNCNPVSACPDQARTIAGLQRDDLFTVVSEHFVTDTARYADLVLPATTQLEQSDLMYAWGHFYTTWNEPAVAPLGESVSNTELFRRLAARFGFDEPVFKRSDEQIALDALDWSHPTMRGITLERLQLEGWAKLSLGAADTRLPHAEGGFPTPSGKAEAASSEADKGSQVLVNFRQCYEAMQPGEALDPVPDYRDFDGGEATVTAAEGSLALVSPKTHYFLNSCYGNFEPLLRRSGEQWVLLHPRDAKARQINPGDQVAVENSVGRIQAVARVGEDTLPGVVVVPHGYWRDPRTRQNSEQASVNTLNPDRPSRLGRAPTFSDTRVLVVRL